ncbi:O-antigen ligase family protein [Pedobacter westerhofensis]|uniref:O-antigen ligase family protein n=1 Tax=Pedobacter westerhofensis TaxID=425512 RepID=UPI001FE5203A|nr:O-antigen ligase family protein [Pedobacter westerhofensis]
MKKSKVLFLVFGIIIAVLSIVGAYALDVLAPVILAILAFAVVFVIFVFKNPKIGLYALIPYCFLLGFLGREIGGFQYGIAIEVLLILTWLSSLVYYKKDDWDAIKNDMCLLFLIWFIISVLEVINPAGASVMGWLIEIRSEALYPVLIIPLTFVVIRNTKDLNIVIKLLLLMALIAALNGIKQVHIGLFPGEQAFLDGPGGATHMIFGKMRAFSFYDAGQFGAFEAAFIVMAIVLAIGSSTLWHKLLLFCIAGTYGYAMLLSGTRGAFFALVVAAVFAIFLTKNFKALIFGGIVLSMFLGVLKFTSIGSGIYSIQRFRSSVDPNDPSLIVRFNTQRVLQEYMSSRPFGGGLGVLGVNSTYNTDKWLSTVQPDSYWVKVWAMTGIVGLTIWFCMMMYILGKCCGIIWMIRNNKLRVKLIALLSTTAGIFFCSYGNEVMNNMPSLLVVCLSFALVYMGPKFDTELADEKVPAINPSTDLTNYAI